MYLLCDSFNQDRVQPCSRTSPDSTHPVRGPGTCAAAAGAGLLPVLQWARDNGCEWDNATCDEAARAGRLDMLQWARTNRAPWSAGTCHGAAEGGHLGVLQWAVQNGGAGRGVGGHGGDGVLTDAWQVRKAPSWPRSWANFSPL